MANEKEKFEYKDWEYGDWSYNPYNESQTVIDARNQATTANNAYNNHINAGFNYSGQNWMNDIIDSIKSRPDFQYDLNGDALYQQYKDKYIQQGKMAMADTMGQAAAMTGGYGSSYASTAGNQAYQASLENLNDIVPQLYQMAYDKYNNETQDLYNQYGLASDQRNFEYGQWTDKASMLDSNRSYYQTNYNNERTYDRNVYDSDRTFSRNVYDADRTFSRNTYDSDRNLAYDEYRNAIADEQWQKEQAAKKNIVEDEDLLGGKGEYNPADQSGIPESVRKTASAKTDNKSLANYIDGLIASGQISEKSGRQLYAELVDDNEKYDADGNISYAGMLESTKGWEVKHDGGWNWFGVGIDADAIVIAPNGEKIRLDNLRDKLIAEGKTKKEAENLIKKLMKDLGI